MVEGWWQWVVEIVAVVIVGKRMMVVEGCRCGIDMMVEGSRITIAMAGRGIIMMMVVKDGGIVWYWMKGVVLEV